MEGGLGTDGEIIQMHFFYLKNSVKNWTKNVKPRKITNTLKTAGNIAKSSKCQSLTQLLGVPQGIIIGFKLYRKKCSRSKLHVIVKVVKINVGSKFGAWVSSHSAILQS